eukprot:TRINITY_DN27197_c0_g3_i2.p1 TRINITY_DN27197_c0_g3~~TRINITY_DN27197_c0_g3_i2.p1  ORF type:complete len:175 (-),score=39.03 TRINITY_DN27197_c0_g3_i2:134-658(-)
MGHGQNMEETSAEFVDKGSKFPSMDDDNQKMQPSKKEENSEELEIVSKPTEHLMDLIVSPLPGKPISSPEDKDIDQEVVNEDQIIEAPHIDFIFGDRLLILEDCDPLVHYQQLMSLIVRSHTKVGFKNQKKQRLQSTSSWKKRSYESSMLCTKDGDQVTNQKVVCLTFEPRGNL